jgi:tripartite-type tricarboxylate transporter receptor subunit TctC
VLRVMSMPDVRERIAATGQTPSPAGAEEFARVIRAEFERWKKVVSAAGIRAE